MKESEYQDLIQNIRFAIDKALKAEVIPLQYVDRLEDSIKFIESFSHIPYRVVEAMQNREFYVLYEDWSTRYAVFHGITTSEEFAKEWVEESKLTRTYRRVGMA